jgi:2-haloacid dehalogenase
MKPISVLAFDVFGTVVDWYGSVRTEIENSNLNVNSNDFTLAWRDGYSPAMQRVASGELVWTRIDELHRIILDDLIKKFEIKGMSEAEIDHLNRVWHRLDPWPDVVEGLTRLKTKYTLCTLSNGNLSLLTNMAKRAELPWDCILSAEVFGKYKPDPETYLGIAKVFDLRPEQVLMVAAHQSDLEAARECGLQTAFVERPDEFGPTIVNDISPSPKNDFHAVDFLNLATQLNC